MIRPVIAVAILLLASFSIVRCTGNADYPVSATVSQYCGTVASYATVCGLDDPCATATVKHCPETAATYSEAGLNVLTTCLDGIECGEAGAAAASACSEYWFANATPSATQAKLGEAYCTACPVAGETLAECEATFYATLDDAGTVFVAGPGYPLLALNDTVVKSAIAQCLPLGTDAGSPGCLSFGGCALQVIEAGTPPLPAACAGGSADASVQEDGGVPGEDAALNEDASLAEDALPAQDGD